MVLNGLLPFLALRSIKVVVTIPHVGWALASNVSQWIGAVNLGNRVSKSGNDIWIRLISQTVQQYGTSFGLQFGHLSTSPLNIADADLSDDVEQDGVITFTSSNGLIWRLPPFVNTTEPYSWPNSGSEAQTFWNDVRSNTSDLSIILTIEVPL